MKIAEAITILDGAIPPPHNKMVDGDHFPIAEAWSVVKAALPADYVQRLDEANEVKAKFPIGTLVHARYDIEAGVGAGMLGRIEAHLGDGRLQVFWHNAFRGEAHPDDLAAVSESGV